MTTTYDPKHPMYLDEADVRGEMARVHDLCHGCQSCIELCTSFPTLFGFVDLHDDQDAGRLTPAQQDQVVDECFQCKRCFMNCPYTPGQHEWAIDFPRLMLRANAMRHEHDQCSMRDNATTAVMGRTDLIGMLATRTAPLANRVVAAKPGSVVRKIVEKVTGVSSVRLLPSFARQRFSTWFENRTGPRIAARRGRVAVFPTCLVEYQAPGIGHDLVEVYERNGIECSLVESAGCCGAPFLLSGDIGQFGKVAAKNVGALAAAVRDGQDIVVPQPMCGYVIKNDYVDHVGGPDAELVAARTFDASEYLMRAHESEGGPLDTDFTGDVPTTVTYHLEAQQIGLQSRDLIELTGAKVTLVQQCSGSAIMWGLRAENTEIALPMARTLGDEIIRVNSDVVAGDCHLANTAIAEQTGEEPVHPLQLIARAYGIAPAHGC